jgi:hypothetical protein
MRAGKIAALLVGAAEPIPEAEIEAIVAPVSFVMSPMKARRDQPAAPCAPPHEPGENLPTSCDGLPHSRRDRQYQTRRADVDRNQQHP